MSEPGGSGAEAPALTKTWWQSLAVYGQRNVLSMLFLGFSSGLPFMLVFSTLSAWLRQAGIQRATIGMLSWVGLVYTIKFVWSPVVDRVGLPLLDKLLGRRRSWILLAQIGIAVGLLNLAASDPQQSVLHIALAALFVAFCSATQDIAIDAWRIESAEPALQGTMAAATQLGYRVAIMVASAGALWAAGEYGWSTSYSLMAACVGIGIVTTLLVREPERRIASRAELQEQRVLDWVERRANWPEPLRNAGAWIVAAIVLPFVDFFARFGWKLALLVLAFVGTYRLTDFTMGVMSNPFYLDMGFDVKQIATVVKFYGLAMSLTGVVLGGMAVAKLGRIRALVLGSVLVICSNLGYAVFASIGKPDVLGLAVIVSMDNLAIGVHGTALIAFLSSLTSAKYTATQYALLSSIYALPGKLLMGASGFVVDAIDYPRFFMYTAALSIPGLLLLVLLVRRDDGPLRH